MAPECSPENRREVLVSRTLLRRPEEREARVEPDRAPSSPGMTDPSVPLAWRLVPGPSAVEDSSPSSPRWSHRQLESAPRVSCSE